MLDRVSFLGRALGDRVGLGKTRPEATQVHLDAAMRWLCRAQDVAKKGTVCDDGVS